MAIIVDGKSIANVILDRLSSDIKAQGLSPHLAVVLVGSDPASFTYVRKKQEAAESIGVKFSLYKYSSAIGDEVLIKNIKRIQQQQSLSGIIVQLPLPKLINKQKVLNALNPEIDVDYLSYESLGKLVIGENPLVPPTPGAILKVIDYHKINMHGKHVVLIGQGDLIGKPLANILIQMPLTLTVCGKETRNLPKFTKQADILITGTGHGHLVRGRMVKKGAVVIDAGVSFKGKKMYGDVNFEEVKKVASVLTPTPGGVGPITVAKLLENVVENSKKSKKKKNV